MKRLLASALLAIAGAAQAELAPGDHRFTIEAGGRERSYIVHVPKSARAAPALILNFHGGGGEAMAHQKYVRMDALAEREGFIAVYPFGSGRLKEKLLTWNAGTCCGSAARENVDDVGFVAALLDDLAARMSYDRARVYATGHSNGAMMAYRLGAELSGRIAAIAPVAGAMVLENPFGTEADRAAPRARQRAMPVLRIHSVDDPRALYAGGLGPPFPFTNSRVMHAPVEETLARWARFDGCDAVPARAERREWRAADATHTALRLVYSGCRDGVEVVLWKLVGPGHVWPGGTPRHMTRLLGPSTAVINANAEMWRFFSRFAVAK